MHLFLSHFELDTSCEFGPHTRDFPSYWMSVKWLDVLNRRIIIYAKDIQIALFSPQSLCGLGGHIVCKDLIKLKFQIKNKIFKSCLFYCNTWGIIVLKYNWLIACLKLKSSHISSTLLAYSGNSMAGDTEWPAELHCLWIIGLCNS